MKIERKEQEKTWKFLIKLFTGTEKEKGRNIERYGNFRYARMWEQLKKRKVEIERKEHGKTWKFLINCMELKKRKVEREGME
jgi:hypothetical protein